MKRTMYSLFCLFILACSSSNTGHPPFDSDQADTENNHFHYEQLLGVKITADVSNLYAFGDEFGADASYYLAFECNQKTAQSIIDSNEFTAETELGIPLTSGFEIEWWNTAEIDTLARMGWKNETEDYFKYFWYNESNNHAYFLDFDL